MSYKRNKQFKHNFNVNQYFGKKYEFNGSFSLPNKVFTTKKWLIADLQKKKIRLNEVKGQLSNFDLQEWSKHTKLRDPSSFIMKFLKKQFNPELLTQAWCKFYECLCVYKIIPEKCISEGFLSTVHLCEAPGGFISSLNHYLSLNYPDLKWKWIGNSLNSEYEGNPLNRMIPDDRLIHHTLDRWHFGIDETGDITKYHNHLDLINTAKKLGQVYLVTADGSIDCMFNPGDQEVIVQHLHYCEVMTALAILQPDGSFIIKMFTFFEEFTVCLLYLLNCSFENVHIFKPSSSKSGNSEVYVICLKYKGLQFLSDIWESLLVPYKTNTEMTTSMFNLNDIDKNFVQQVIDCADLFMKKQMFTINENVKYFNNRSSFEKMRNYELKTFVANHYIMKYKLKSISRDRKIVQNDVLENATFYNRLWNWKEKWNFENNYKILNTLDVINKSKYCHEKHFNIKTGKQIDTVLYSSFCVDVMRLNPAIFSKNCNQGLYNIILDKLQNVTVINSKNFGGLPQHKVHRLLFNEIKNISGTTIFLGLFFGTRFLIGLLFLLMLAFKQACFCKGGLIMLSGVEKEKLKCVKDLFNLIEQKWNDIDKQLNIEIDQQFDFEFDIVSVISLLQLEENPFFYTLWQYNNSLMLDNK